MRWRFVIIGRVAGKGAASPNLNVNLTATFTAKVPVYRTDGEPGAAFTPLVRNFVLPQERYCLYTFGSRAGQTCSTPSLFTGCVCAEVAPNFRFTYATRCESAHLDLSFLSPDLDFPALTFPGNLRLYTDVAIGVTLPPPLNFITIPPIPVLNDQALGYVTRGKDQSEVDAAIATLDPLLTDPAAALALLGEGGMWGALFDEDGNLSLDLANLSPELLDQVLQLLPFVAVVSPINVPPIHAYHEACRTEEEVDFDVRFTKTATWVQAGSGNEQLNFKAWAPLGKFFGLFDTTIHFKASSGITRASGILLSRTAMFFINLEQLDGRPGNLVKALLDGPGVTVDACMTFLPWVCQETTLGATQAL